MCLDTVTRSFRLVEHSSEERTAYKGMELMKNGQVRFPNRHSDFLWNNRRWWHRLFCVEPKVTGKWLRDRNNEMIYMICSRYRAGFHVFPTREAAMSAGYADSSKNTVDSKSVLVEVKVRNILVEGMQDRQIVWVARDIFIPPVKKWFNDDAKLNNKEAITS